VTRQKTGYSEV